MTFFLQVVISVWVWKQACPFLVPHCSEQVWKGLWKVKVLVNQLCLTLCNPIDCNLPGTSVYGIFQARILEYVAISFSRNLPDPDMVPMSPAWQVNSLPLSHLGSPFKYLLKTSTPPPFFFLQLVSSFYIISEKYSPLYFQISALSRNNMYEYL